MSRFYLSFNGILESFLVSKWSNALVSRLLHSTLVLLAWELFSDCVDLLDLDDFYLLDLLDLAETELDVLDEVSLI